MKTFKKLILLLSFNDRKKFFFLLGLINVMAFLDMMGVASILPFMTVLLNPDVVETNFLINKIFIYSKIFGVKTIQDFIFFLGIAVFFLLVVSLFLKACVTYFQVHFVQISQHNISTRLVEGYLNKKYSWFLNRNSSDLAKNILSEVGEIVSIGIAPLLELISKTIITIVIISMLMFVNSKLTFIAGILLTLVYTLIYYSYRKILSRIGKEKFLSNELRFKSINEAFGGIKEVKFIGLEDLYKKNFKKLNLSYVKTVTSSVVISQLPRFFIEAVAFGGILLITLILLSMSKSPTEFIPLITLYVFASYRLIPALQIIYGAVAQLTYIGPTLNKLYDDFEKLKDFNVTQNSSKTHLPFKKEIYLKNIYFEYPNSTRVALKKINLRIPIKSSVGLVGVTGSGKTTIVDIIMGLLEPQNGKLEIDDIVINNQNVRTWQKNIGYVPQFIYLSDDTVSANITFGLNSENINQEEIEKVCKIVNLHDFIINELPEQYDTKIGERGIRLSGGQRQRIGIARALYRKPKVLVFDEATSALDNKTEKEIINAINNINKDITMITIAHRLNTLKNCDTIYRVNNGEIVQQGTFNKIVNNKFKFKKE